MRAEESARYLVGARGGGGRRGGRPSPPTVGDGSRYAADASRAPQRTRRESKFQNGMEQRNLNNKLVSAFIKRVSHQNDLN